MWARLLESELVRNLGYWMHELWRGIFVSECNRDVKKALKIVRDVYLENIRPGAFFVLLVWCRIFRSRIFSGRVLSRPANGYYTTSHL